ncbi:alkaline phosphatase family protein, partial [Ideonella sp.]|uniref:alkaline phosphatase family protein n=1 Tax=Ideonella sp. TaxID=1929293 RepID=UPI003BB68643
WSPAVDAATPLAKGIANTMNDGGFLQSLRDDIAAGQLPQVSWVVAPATYSEHPGPSCPAQGAWYVEQVLNALTAQPEVWSKTVLIVNFDENDGFFDHMPPPAAPSLNADGSEAGAATCDVSAERFTHPAPPGTQDQPRPDKGVYGMGPRVPMLLLSPWSRGGWVNSQVFDHTSVLQFLERRFGVQETNISPWRRAVAGDLTSAFNFLNPNSEVLPTLPELTRSGVDALRAAQEALPRVPVPSEASQTLPQQASGVRPSRALPYALAVQATPEGTSIRLDFINTGSAGAVFHVYDRLHLRRRPRRYTVEAGKALAGSWKLLSTAGRYDLWVLGPNGFHRLFVGQLAARRQGPAPEIRVEPQPRGQSLQITVRNAGTAGCSVAISPLAYRQDGPWTLNLAAGTEQVWQLDLSAQQGWHDLQISSPDLPTWQRRVAGRLETGRHSISDPAMGVGARRGR